MDKRITISDVAEALGVSKTTVSRAISGKGRIGKETRERILEYIAENDYKPNVIAKGLAQSKTYNIAMIMPDDCKTYELPFFQTCMYGVCEVAAKSDYDVLAVYASGNNTKNLERILENNKIDGVILSRTTVDDSITQTVKKKGIPFVAIGSTEDEAIVRVDHDHRSACRELTMKLLKSGLSHLALIGGNNTHMVTQRRFQGFTDAFKECGMEPDSELVFLNVEDTDAIESITTELVKKETRCIVCMDDMICARVLQKLQREQISVPEDIKVASFYNSNLLESHVPSVTTLEFDVIQLGKSAAEVLLKLIENQPTKEITLLPYKVGIKETT